MNAMRVVFATAEFAPLAAVGGLAAASAGLVRSLRSQGVDVELVLPDYRAEPLVDESATQLEVPAWAGPARLRSGSHRSTGPVHLVSVPGIARPHPYVDLNGVGWPDNDARFLAFSAAVVALADRLEADVVHLNDWHTAAATAWLRGRRPSVLSIHNLAYQGTTSALWLERFGANATAFEWFGSANPLKGGLLLADALVAVSPSYAAEICTPAGGFGLDRILTERGVDLVGILNGIDTDIWNPACDDALTRHYRAGEPPARFKNPVRKALAESLGLRGDEAGPLAVMVTRLTEQKGLDLVLPLLDYLDTLPLRLAVLGSGDAELAGSLTAAAAADPGRVAFIRSFDEVLAHRLFAGADLLLMPSRFEPCGLTQMQALRYGTLPVATAVGGLRDTVVDLDADPENGNGWLARSADPLAVLDALHRAVRGWSNRSRRQAAQQRGMARDWSWHAPASQYANLYRSIVAAQPRVR